MAGHLALAIALAACGEVTSAIDAAPGDAVGQSDAPIDGPSGPFLAVSNYGTNAITFYATTDTGNLAPRRMLVGPATLIGTPKLATENGELFAANANDINVYSATADGNVAPIRRIAGAATGFSAAGTAVTAIAVRDGEIFVTVNGTAGGAGAASIRVFSATATGDVAPLRIISGTPTLLSSPLGIAVFGGEIFVANNGSSTVTVYPATGTGGIAPLRSLSGTDISRPSGIDVLGTELFVEGTDSIRVFPRGASGNTAAATRNITGAATGLDFSYDIAIHDGEIYTHHRNNNAVLVYPLTGTGNITPTRTISGAATLLASPQSCVVIP